LIQGRFGMVWLRGGNSETQGGSRGGSSLTRTNLNHRKGGCLKSGSERTLSGGARVSEDMASEG